jgi:5-methylcytosine-specific restriction endonuclease McrA
MATYAEKLKDPRWQKKRLEILERDEWRCCWCEDEKEQLHVHHGCYQYGFDPWDYDDETMWTLCASCHRYVEERMAEIRDLIGRIPPTHLSFAKFKLLTVVFSFEDASRQMFRDGDWEMNTTEAWKTWV